MKAPDPCRISVRPLSSRPKRVCLSSTHEPLASSPTSVLATLRTQRRSLGHVPQPHRLVTHNHCRSIGVRCDHSPYRDRQSTVGLHRRSSYRALLRETARGHCPTATNSFCSGTHPIQHCRHWWLVLFAHKGTDLCVPYSPQLPCRTGSGLIVPKIYNEHASLFGSV